MLNKDEITEALKEVVDPELGVNIVDLGLVYDVTVDDDGKVFVQYTLTTMGCPIGPLIEMQMKEAVNKLEGCEDFTSEYVMRPPWNLEMMTDEGKAQLGYVV